MIESLPNVKKVLGSIPRTREKKGRKLRQKMHTWRPAEGRVYRGTKPETICRQTAFGATGREQGAFQKHTNIPCRPTTGDGVYQGQ